MFRWIQTQCRLKPKFKRCTMKICQFYQELPKLKQKKGNRINQFKSARLFASCLLRNQDSPSFAKVSFRRKTKISKCRRISQRPKSSGNKFFYIRNKTISESKPTRIHLPGTLRQSLQLRSRQLIRMAKWRNQKPSTCNCRSTLKTCIKRFLNLRSRLLV